jgi:ubiquinone/menaquinone biosynthesis C-methylase UbiE
MDHSSSSEYFIDHESPAEMSRLEKQDRQFTKAMGGLFAERSNDFTDLRRVLDVGCGPGVWAQEVAFTFSEVEVVGIDISQTMINYATTQAKLQELYNVTFSVMDITEPLKFPDASFDFVNARLLGFLSPEQWPLLLREYIRITRPGGFVRLTETEMTETNSSALACEHEWFYKSLYLAGQSFSPNGSSLAITAMLAPLLRKAGCQNVKVAAYPIDWSSGTEDHDDMRKDIEVGFKLMEPFYLAAKVATAEEMATTYDAMRAEMDQDDFCALHLLVSVCGQKPI